MTGLVTRLGAMTAAVLLLSALAPATTNPADAAPAVDHNPVTPIRHVVVMTQDQRSFDNYFGSRQGVDGIPSQVCLPLKAGSTSPCVKPFALKTSGVRTPLRPTAVAQKISVHGGRMDGFVYAQATRQHDGRAAMGYYNPEDIPIMTELADQGVLFDHWFSSVPGGSIQNRLFAVSGQSTADQLEVPAGGWRNIPLIFDRLQAAGVSWRIYVENYEPSLTISTAAEKARRGGQVARVPVLATARFAENPQLASHVVDIGRYYADLAAGTLPAVSYVVSTSSTERPPNDPNTDQLLVRSVVNSLSESSSWNDAAFLLDYDSSGGWYDHVAPPTQNGSLLGLRVPALLVSPYAVTGAVNHTVFDSASTLRFIEHNWSLQPLTRRDAQASDLSTAFSFGQPVREPTLIGVHDARPALIRPSSAIIYTSYTIAFLLVVAVVAWAALGERRRHREPRHREPVETT
jgi:phospholipase C